MLLSANDAQTAPDDVDHLAGDTREPPKYIDDQKNRMFKDTMAIEVTAPARRRHKGIGQS